MQDLYTWVYGNEQREISFCGGQCQERPERERLKLLGEMRNAKTSNFRGSKEDKLLPEKKTATKANQLTRQAVNFIIALIIIFCSVALLSSSLLYVIDILPRSFRLAFPSFCHEGSSDLVVIGNSHVKR
jgi:hypothetical protein